MERLGLIAGNGRFPILFAQSAKARGIRLIAVAIEGEASLKLKNMLINCTGSALQRLAD